MLKYVNRKTFSTLVELYQAAITAKGLHFDPKQIQVLNRLQILNNQIASSHSSWKRHSQNLTLDDQNLSHSQNFHKNQSTKNKQSQPKSKSIFSFFRRGYSTGSYLQQTKGLYLYGGSGCGKSFLSDLFYSNLSIVQKQKLHFHQFMSGIHAQLHELQRNRQGYDPLIKVANRRASLTRLLYLDQFQVTDVADASILRRLFQNLLSRGVILLATSNRHPTDLYKNGHQRQFFVPCIELIQRKCEIFHLQSPDYRLLMQRSADSKQTTYLNPINQANQQRFQRVLKLVAGTNEITYESVQLQPVKGRKITVKKAVGNVCMYDFNQLMDSIMGDTDFRAICKNFKAVFIRGMRTITRQERNIANRLIKLFDEAYFRQVKIYILADTPIDMLISPPTDPKNQQDFALIRCHSRLIQFQTKAYKELKSYCEEPHVAQK